MTETSTEQTDQTRTVDFMRPGCEQYAALVRQLAGEVVKTASAFDEPVDCNPHNLRHSFATWLARSESIAKVQKILGHESVHTTMRYYVHTGDNELVGATANLGGRRRPRTEAPASAASEFRVIPFPKRNVS